MRIFSSLAVAASTVALAAPAAAAIIINVGPGALQPEENLLFGNDPPPASAIQGITNDTGSFVSLFGGETLMAQGSGQARLDTLDGQLDSSFDFRGLTSQLGVELSKAGLGFTSTEFRLFGGTATEATLSFVGASGEMFQETFAIPENGFFSATATEGELIDYFAISTNGSVDDVRQVRIGGVQALVALVPEPAAWAMMILGFGGVGGLARSRRRAVA